MYSDKIIHFLKELNFKGSLPEGISIMNPYRDPLIMSVVSQFYHKFYEDNHSRYLILGINPGRFGAGVTGIPFTDSKRLSEKCGLTIPGLKTFETSSAYIYEMIEAFGGMEKFYNRFFISAVSPLGFTFSGEKGVINYNYYDSNSLAVAVKDFAIECLETQLEFGIERDRCFCLGTGKNYKYLLQLNNQLKYFGKIIPLEHPRFIMQYKSRQKDQYIQKYVETLGAV